MYRQTIDFKPHETLLYLRKSRSDDPTLSVEEVLEKHESILDEWAERFLGTKIPEENKFREIVSGETLKERPQINIVLRKAESPFFKAIAVVEPQRLTRGDLEDIGRLMKLLKHTNTYIATPQRVYDLQDEYDWDALERELKRGNDYLEYTKKILSRGRLLSVSQGNFIGSVPPYGYDKIWITDGKRKSPTLTENKEEADAVRMIYDLYVNQDMGTKRICNHLNSLGIKPRKNDYWTPPAIIEILQNAHYIGKVKWNWRKVVTVVENSEILKTRPKSAPGDYLLFEGKHEAIIPEELYNAAQEKHGRNHRAKPITKLRNPFSSLLYCQCGRAMTLRTKKIKSSEKIKEEARLICDNQAHCHTGSCLYSEIMERVCKTLKENIESFEVYLKNHDEEKMKLHSRLIKHLENKLKIAEEKELSQWEAQSHPDPAQRMPADIFKQLKEKVLKEKAEIQQALKTAYESMPEHDNYTERLIRFQTALDALTNPEIDVEEKNKLLKGCIERMEYHREKPERIQNTQKRIRINGKYKKPNTLPVGANWTSPPIILNIKLKF